jgi:hypothetical protein
LIRDRIIYLYKHRSLWLHLSVAAGFTSFLDALRLCSLPTRTGRPAAPGWPQQSASAVRASTATQAMVTTYGVDVVCSVVVLWWPGAWTGRPAPVAKLLLPPASSHPGITVQALVGSSHSTPMAADGIGSPGSSTPVSGDWEKVS